MDLNIFQKLKEVYDAVRKAAWYLLPISGIIYFVKWVFFEWLPSRAKQMLQWVIGQIPQVDITPSSVGISWDRVNQWVPVNEALAYGAMFITLAGMITLVKWVKKLLPF